jgi:hypothetical protein
MRWLKRRSATRRNGRRVEIDLRDATSAVAEPDELHVVLDVSDAAAARAALHAYPQSVSVLPGINPMWDRGETWDSATQRSEVVSSSAWIEEPGDDKQPDSRDA